MCQNQRNNTGNSSGNTQPSRPVTESGSEQKKSYDYSDYHNDGNDRITTTSQDTGGTLPKQGE